MILKYQIKNYYEWFLNEKLIISENNYCSYTGNRINGPQPLTDNGLRYYNCSKITHEELNERHFNQSRWPNFRT